MLFTKKCIRFEQSVKLNSKTKVYELFVLSNFGFYEFKNGNQVQEFAEAYTCLIDEVVFNLELYILKFNSLSAFLQPINKTKFSKEKIFIESIYEVQHYCQQLKLSKVYDCEFYNVNAFVLNACDCLLNICTTFDKRFINDINQLYQALQDLRQKFVLLLSSYSKGISNKEFTLNQAINLNNILQND